MKYKPKYPAVKPQPSIEICPSEAEELMDWIWHTMPGTYWNKLRKQIETEKYLFETMPKAGISPEAISFEHLHWLEIHEPTIYSAMYEAMSEKRKEEYKNWKAQGEYLWE